MEEIPDWAFIAVAAILVFAVVVLAARTSGGMRKPVHLIVLVLVTVGYIFSLTFIKDVSPQLGLDLQGGVSIVLEAQGITEESDLDVAINIIRNRVDAIGVAEPEITRQGNNNIIVDLPGADNAQEAQALIGQTAELRFRQVAQNLDSPEVIQVLQQVALGSAPSGASLNPTSPIQIPEQVPVPGGPGMSFKSQGQDPAGALPVITSVDLQCGGTNPQTYTLEGDLTKPTPRDQDDPDKPIIALDRDSRPYLLCPTILKGDIVEEAGRSVDQNSGAVNVSVGLTDEGGRQFTELIGRPLSNQSVAIVLDSEVVSAPNIQPELANGLTNNSLTITMGGEGDQTEAVDELATVLRYGSLNVVLEQQTAQQISATLGTDQLRAGLVAGAVGLFFVVIYMFLYYRILALVIVTATILLGLSLYAIVSWLGVTEGLVLTLAGAVGLIVSLGVTVDSYIVYFEKLKEEIKQGRTVRSSLDNGFRKAFKTILAGDIVSLIGAVVLYFLAAGSVRGFAFFLGLSTLLDLILALCFMHPMVKLIARNESLVNARFFGLGAALGAKSSKDKVGVE